MLARHNVEIKARLPSLENALEIARRVATAELATERQVDTYFRVPHGRLKLREINDESAVLIWYDRPDQSAPKDSRYFLVPVADPATMKTALTAACGVRQVVVKRRRILLFHQVRIHLDQVEGQGSFLELEAVLASADDYPEGQRRVGWLLEQLQVDDADLLPGSYGDA